ncbi:zinc-dependent metalloprotease family protein [Pseudomonas sp. NPDC087358]|uniref:zinc-dependent metalloprotease family protein n=1 Tax=Pseudomonas sp. NPDC087358 TaxID=3364439 RepID=UPI00384D1AC0
MKVISALMAVVSIAMALLYLTFKGPSFIQTTPETTEPDAAFTAAVGRIREFAATLEVQEVDIDPRAVTLDQKTLEFTLIDHSITARKVRSEQVLNPDGTQSIVWYGNLEPHASVVPEIAQWQDPLNFITLVKSGQTVTGTIRQGGQLYQLRPVGSHRHVVIVLDGTKMPPETDNVELPKRTLNPAPAHSASNRSAAPVTLDVMTVVPQQTVTDYQGDMLALMQLAVALANQSYINSNIDMTLRLVSYQVTDYVPNAAFPGLDLIRLRTPNDGFMDDSLSVRDQVRADVVIYIYRSAPAGDDSQSCGQALQYGSTADTAFAMVNHECIANFTFGHEIGHLQFARHEFDSDPSLTPYPFAHGYRFTAGGHTWHTVMGTQPNPPTSQRLNIWSNPDIRYEGAPLGDAESADNHRVLETTKEAISGYR